MFQLKKITVLFIVCFLINPVFAQNVSHDLQIGMYAYEQGKYETAIKYFTKVLPRVHKEDLGPIEES